MTEHMCQLNPMRYYNLRPLPAFRAQSNRKEFQTKANFRSVQQNPTHFITIESSSQEPISTPFNKILHNSSLFITFGWHRTFCSSQGRQNSNQTQCPPQPPHDAWRMPSIFDIVIRKMLDAHNV